MAEDWAANVKKYVPDADDGIIAGIVRYCGIALQKRDSSLVSFSDTKETDRVRENYLKKKLGLTHSDDKLNAAIADVGTRMKGENFKNRVTVYYLLAAHFGLLGMFSKAGKAPAAKVAPVKAAAATAAAASLANLGANDSDADDSGSSVGGAVTAGGTAALGAVAASAAPVATAAPIAAAQPVVSSYGEAEEEKSGWGWLVWLLLAALVLGVLWWLFRGKEAATTDSAVTTEQSAPAADAAAVTGEALPAAPPPAEGTVAIPTGAGVTTEARDGKPVVKVYFDTGKAAVVPAFGAAAGGLKAYLDSHAGSSLAVSGYNDKTGNVALNAELSKKRAQAVKAALVTSGIADASVALVKPAESTDTTSDNAGARRVEVVVK